MFTTAAVPPSVLTFLLVHYFSIQCLCLGKVLLFAGNSFALATSFQSPILSSPTQGREGSIFIGEIAPRRASLLSALPSSQFSTSRTKNLDTMWTLTAQYRHRGAVLAVTGLWLNSSNLSRISVMRTRETSQGNIFDGNPTSSSYPVVKFQFSNPSSILSTEVKFNLAKWMDYVILTSIPSSRYWPELDLFLSPPLTSHSAVETLIERGFCWYWNIISYLVSWRHWPRFLTPPSDFLSCFWGRNKWLSSRGREKYLMNKYSLL